MERAIGCTMDATGFQGLFKQGLNLRYMILEPKLIIAGERELCFRPFDHEESFYLWDRGRVFGPDCEIRWLKDIDKFRVLIIGQVNELERISDLLPEDKVVQELPSIASPREYFLWGERTASKKNEYLEMRIPIPLLYPVEGHGSLAKLAAMEYRNPTTGELEFYRFFNLVEIKS